MIRFNYKIKKPDIAVLNKFFFWRKPPSAPHTIGSRRLMALSPAKQVELDRLCLQLFKNKALITSGKLQLIGLAKIKKRMGKQWAGLSKIVFDTVEEVIDLHLDKSDIFIRFQDDTYIMIFARSSLEESREKGNRIALEIQKRLFAMDEAELRKIEVRQALREIRADMPGQSFPDFLDALFPDDDEWLLDQRLEMREQPPNENFTPGDIDAVEVDAADYRPELRVRADEEALIIEMNCAYSPLWEVRRNALTTHLCLAHETQPQSDLFQSHRALYAHRSLQGKATLDKRILSAVMAELERMEAENRKLLLICPVQLETLYNMESYEDFKQQLLKIPPVQRQFLILMVMNMDDFSPPKNAYWFATPLRQFCRHVFAEIPLRRDINFNYLRSSGVDVVGVRLDGTLPEHEAINTLNAFCTKAKSLKIPKTFILNVPTLSLATSAVCAGFDFLGGAVIGAPGSPRPEDIRRYRPEDLIAHLIGDKKLLLHRNNQ